jgi:DNA repair photolyase
MSESKVDKTTLDLTGRSDRQTMNGKPVFQVRAKSVLNLESGFSHKLLCDGPTFSLGSACAYSCTFCYVEDLMRKNPHWRQVILTEPGAQFQDVVIRREGSIDALRMQLTYADGSPRYMGDEQMGRVCYASPLVDVAANMELVRETIEACRMILELTRWDIRLLSKSTLLPKVAEALDADQNRRMIYGVSTGTMDDGIARAFERGTPIVSKRIESLHTLQDAGCRTYGMLCPSLPDPSGRYDEMAKNMAVAIRSNRCEHVWAEVINVRGDSMRRTVAALRDAGYLQASNELARVSRDKAAWESYARATFEAHANVYSGSGKLRFLQYVTAATKRWWSDRRTFGAVLL